MMSKKIPQCSAVDQDELDRPSSICQVQRPGNSAPGCRKNSESSSLESGSLNGDGKRRKMRHRNMKRPSNPESRPEKSEERPVKRSSQRPDVHPGLAGLQAECASVWLERSVYERAESLYQCWLASPSNSSDRSNGSPSAPRKPSKSPPNKATFDQAESTPSAPNSLDLLSRPSRSVAPRTPDEGYQSLAPTPATPVIQQAVVMPTNRQPINGLPRVPVELLRDVWLEKPLYDRAEAAFYQNLYGSVTSKRSTGASAARSSDHPQSLVEEEEEEEEEEEKKNTGVLLEEKRAALPGKAEVFHALLPIQEEEEPAEVPERDEVPGSGAPFLAHPDSERVWLDKSRYDAAENRFHVCNGSKAAAKKGRRPGAASRASTAPSRDNTMSSVDFLAQDKIWFDKPLYDEAERRFYERVCGSSKQKQAAAGANAILQDIARARENIQKSLAGLKTTLCNRSAPPPLSQQSQLSSSGGGAADQGELVSRIKGLELENQTLNRVVEALRAALSKLECRVAVLEKPPVAETPAPARSLPCTNGTAAPQQSSDPVKEEDDDEDDDDDFDLFGSDEDEEAEKRKEERLKAYAEKKAKKPAVIAKSSILLDVKPWDDETDMAKLEECVRSIQADGLLWGMSKLVPVGYGIKKLQIACVVEDDKVGTDLLEEEITKFEDYVQSVDVAAFNKI